MDANTIILLVEAVVIALLSIYVWLGTQDEEQITTTHWVALAVLVLLVIGFVVTLSFNPMMN
jgi:hypothetical protein